MKGKDWPCLNTSPNASLLNINWVSPGKGGKLVSFRNYLRLPGFLILTPNVLWDQMWFLKKIVGVFVYGIFFFPLKNKAKGKKTPTISWLSGSFYKQRCDEKHMADQRLVNSYGGFAAP